MRKISRRGAHSPDNAEFGHFTLLVCTEDGKEMYLLFSDVAVAVAVVVFLIKLPTCSIERVTVLALTMIFCSSERVFSDYSRI